MTGRTDTPGVRVTSSASVESVTAHGTAPTDPQPTNPKGQS